MKQPDHRATDAPRRPRRRPSGELRTILALGYVAPVVHAVARPLQRTGRRLAAVTRSATRRLDRVADAALNGQKAPRVW